MGADFLRALHDARIGAVRQGEMSQSDVEILRMTWNSKYWRINIDEVLHVF